MVAEDVYLIAQMSVDMLEFILTENTLGCIGICMKKNIDLYPSDLLLDTNVIMLGAATQNILLSEHEKIIGMIWMKDDAHFDEIDIFLKSE